MTSTAQPSLVRSPRFQRPRGDNDRFEMKLNPNQFIAGQKLSLENLEFLGKGGNGSVFRMLIREGELRGLIVAVKFLETLDNDERLKRFEQEIQVLQDVNHPHIIKVLDRGQYRTAGRIIPFFVMEYQPRNLERETRSHPRGLPPDSVLPICLQMASALVHIHGKGVEHGDLKPANILFDGSSVKLADFGLASLVEKSSRVRVIGEKIGPHFFLSPEQWRWWKEDSAERPGKKSDIFQLGLVFVKTVSGFNPNTVQEWEKDSLHPEPKSKLWSTYSGSLVSDIVGLSRDMIEVDPSKRPDAESVQERLLSIFRAYSSHFKALYGVSPGREF
jgi:serine/threonine-protein kinase